MGAPKNRQPVKLEVKNFASGGTVGTSYVELIGVVKESKGITWEPKSVTLGNDEELNAGGKASLDFQFTECAAAGATEANLQTDIKNGVRFLVKATYLDGSTETFGDTTKGVMIMLATDPKSDVKMFSLKATQSHTQRSLVIAEA